MKQANMKQAFYLLIFIFAFTMTGNAQSAQDRLHPAPDQLRIVSDQSRSAPEKAVAASVDSLTNALLHPDKIVLESLLSDDLTYGHSAGLVQDKAGIIDGLVNGSFRFLTIDISDQTIRVLKDIALVRYVLVSDYTDKGTTGKVKFGILLVWRQEDGQWKLLARQAVKL
jgi:hypothetical protein